MRSPEAVAAMPCPVCKTGLAMSERQGIEIDYCPTCRGVWLDRGELDKIIERSAAEMAPQQMPQPPRPSEPPRSPASANPWGGGDYRHESSRGHDPRYYKKRKRSFLDDLFD
ncbi:MULTISPECIES: zf-TFIIB domain-containing protein [unclassified Sphingosinithalassobacter]|uniref:TFIIB-type zinc ribbon-containing protein n=1 Tax=unclassified Sphingosinithalassobacter TaxID=2676235 RepID=UPI00165D3FAB|nr:zf-TFIIB domain-containing protein [Sphingosinithalassobacter sp. CS137]